MQEGSITSEAVGRAFGQTLRRLRLERGISQEKLAEASSLDRTYISMLERGIRQPSLTAIFRLADALHTTAAQLVEDTQGSIVL